MIAAIVAKEHSSVCVGTQESIAIGFYRDIPYLQINPPPPSHLYGSTRIKG
jgi:hypothetical protein